LYSYHSGEAGTELTSAEIILPNSWKKYRFLYLVVGNGTTQRDSKFIPTYYYNFTVVFSLNSLFYDGNLPQKNVLVELPIENTSKAIITLPTYSFLRIIGVR